MSQLLYGLFAVVHVAIGVWALRVAVQQRSISGWLIVLAVLSLAYDNAILATGTLIGTGPLLLQLNLGRYVLHAVSTPLLMLAGLALTRNAGVHWAWRRGITILTVLTVVGFVAYDTMNYLGSSYVVAQEGVLRYVIDPPHHGPPLAPITTMTFLIAFGIALYIEHRSWWVLAGALAMFSASAFQLGVIANLGEIALMVALVASSLRFPTLTKAGYLANVAAMQGSVRDALASEQRARKRRVAIGNRALAWVIFVSLTIDTIAVYGPSIGIVWDRWVHLTFSNIYILLFFVHAVASLYFYGVPRLQSHIRVVHIYIGYGVFLFTMVSQSLIGVEPIHIITYVINWIFIGAHILLSFRFMLQRVRRQQVDPMLEMTVSPHLRQQQ